MESATDKSVKLPMFRGDRSDFAIYWIRLKAYASVQKYGDILVETRNVDLPDMASSVLALDATVAAEKLQIDAVKKNAMAMANFTMSFQTEQLMQLVIKSITVGYPEGLAHTVVAGLIKKFQPNDRMSKVELIKAMSKVHMSEEEDPTVLFEMLSGIENRFRTVLNIDE